MTDDPEPRFRSYCCPACPKGSDENERGWIDPDIAAAHMRGRHPRSKRSPTVRYWPHSVITYDSYDVSGIVGPMR